MTAITRYMPSIILGMLCAETDLFVKIKNFSFTKKHFYLNKTIKFILESGILAASVIIRQNPSFYKFVDISDCIYPFLVICFSYEFLAEIPGLNAVLKLIGHHSTNIFLFHTFIRCYFWESFTYSFKYPWLITLVLLAISILFSIAFELIKKLTRYNKLPPLITNKICNKLDKAAAK